MATPSFPSLIPNSIAFDQGVPDVNEYRAFGSGPIRFRHSLYINNQLLSITYRALDQASVELIRNHYHDVGGTSGAFTVPLAIWGSAELAETTSQYRYAETPTEEHTGIHYNVTVSLRLLRGTIATFILDGGGATLAAEEVVDSYVFSGTAPFILNGSDSVTSTLVLNAIELD